MSRLEVRYPELEVIELDDSFEPITHKGRVRIVSDGSRAISVLGPGEKRDRLIANYLSLQRQKPRPEVVVHEQPTVVPVETVEHVAEITDAVLPVDQAIDEEVEAQEFLSSLDEQELCPVQPTDWWEARIHRASRGGRTLIVKLENAKSTCIPRFISKAPGEHRMCLPTYLPNAVAAVRLEIVNERYRCLEMQLDQEPTSLHETAKVIDWDSVRNIGRAERPCGCRIFIAGMLDEAVYGTPNVGDWIAFDLEKSRSRGNWVGIRARKIDAPIAQENKV